MKIGWCREKQLTWLLGDRFLSVQSTSTAGKSLLLSKLEWPPLSTPLPTPIITDLQRYHPSNKSPAREVCTVLSLLYPVLGQSQHYPHPVPPPASRSTPFPPTSPQWWFCASTWNISTLFSNICPYTPLLTQCRGQSLLTHSKHGRCQRSVTFPWATNKESPPALHPPFPVSFHTQVLLLVSQVNPELSYKSYPSDTLRTTRYPSILLLYRVPPISICTCSKHAQAFI